MKTLGRNCAYKRKAHKEQECGELCECDCHKICQECQVEGGHSWNCSKKIK